MTWAWIERILDAQNMTNEFRDRLKTFLRQCAVAVPAEPTVSEPVIAYCKSVETMTMADLMAQSGDTEALRSLLYSLAPTLEALPGPVQVMAHVLLLAELFAMMDDNPLNFHPVDERIQCVTAEIRRAVQLSHEMRALHPDTKRSTH